MHQTEQQRAQQCGARVAKLWKRLTKTITGWDRLCVTRARNHKLPAWTGHIPVTVIVMVSLTAIAVVGFIIGSIILMIILIIWAYGNHSPCLRWRSSISDYNRNCYNFYDYDNYDNE